MRNHDLGGMAVDAIDGTDDLLCLVVSHPGSLSMEARRNVREMVEHRIEHRVPVIVVCEGMAVTPVYLSNAELLKHQERCEQ